MKTMHMSVERIQNRNCLNTSTNQCNIYTTNSIGFIVSNYKLHKYNKQINVIKMSSSHCQVSRQKYIAKVVVPFF